MTKETILSQLVGSAISTTARTKTGTKIHAMDKSGQGRTYCGVRNATPVKPASINPKFAHLCDKCFILDAEEK